MASKPPTNPKVYPFPPVAFELVGQDGNAFGLLGAFRVAALRAGWSKEQFEAVREEACSNDYDHLLQTLLAHSYDPDTPPPVAPQVLDYYSTSL